MKLQIRNYKQGLPKPLGKPRLLRLLEELTLMRRFKSSKEEFDKGKREEMKDKRKKEATDKKEYAERQIERKNKKELKRAIEKIRERIEITKEYFDIARLISINTVMDIYSIKPDTEQLDENIKQKYPRFSKWVNRITKYGYWFGLARLGTGIKDVIGASLAYTLVVYHPFFFGVGNNYFKVRKEVKNNDITDRLVSLKNTLQPNRATQVLTFSLLELASFPIFVGTIERISNIEKTVTPEVAMGAVALGTVTAIAIEYIGFRFLWRKLVLNSIPTGKINDDMHGFINEFNPARLFYDKKDRKKADTASEYIGQIWGVIESYWIWVQAGRLAIAYTITSMYDLSPTDFMKTFMTALIGGYSIFIDLIIPRYIDGMQKKLNENNEHLQLDN